MEYSLLIELWVDDLILKYLFSIENFNNYSYKGVLEDVTDKYSSGHKLDEFYSKSINENIYKLSRYLSETPNSFLNIVAISDESKFLIAMIDQYIDEINSEKKENKLELFFKEIKKFPKKYCSNNIKYGYKEWIEVIIKAETLH